MKRLILVVFLLAALPAFSQQSRLNALGHLDQPVFKPRSINALHSSRRPMNAQNIIFSENFDSGIPSSWTVSDNAGTGAVWTEVNNYYGSTLNGTPFAMADSDGAGSVDMDTSLESPTIDLSSVSVDVFLRFEHYFKYYSGGGNEQGDVDVFDGTNWITVYSVNTDTGNWGAPDIQLINITPYANANFKVRFHYYNANYDWYWAVDNVEIISANDDLAMVWGIPGVSWPDSHTSFSCIVQNTGTNVINNFDVNVTVVDASSTTVHTENISVTGANLTAGSFYKINFNNPWTPTSTGTYTLSYTLSFPTDNDPSNNTYSRNLEVIRPTYQDNVVHSFVTYDDDSSGDQNYFGHFDMTTGDFTVRDSIQGMFGDYLMAGDYIKPDSIIMVVDNSNTTYVVGNNGNVYEYGFIPFLSEVVTGLGFNTGQPYVYASTTDSLLHVTPFLDYTAVGRFNLPNPAIIGMAFDGTHLYALDVTTDSLYTVDPTSANLSGIGHVGYNLYYVQDIGMDYESGTLYGTLFDITNSPNYVSGLFVFDVTTGQATPVGTTYSDEYTICVPIGQHQTAISENRSNYFVLYPNPAMNTLHIHVNNLPEKVVISDMSGKVVSSYTPVEKKEKIIDLNVSGLQNGIYLLTLSPTSLFLSMPEFKKCSFISSTLLLTLLLFLMSMDFLSALYISETTE